ncbi:MAG: hypothetical protein F6K42_02665 [Leptolyngbya sp. SIO1D8]|nr:hypothetical protein [Leptolyngbya sp. SIO1D8]
MTDEQFTNGTVVNQVQQGNLEFDITDVQPREEFNNLESSRHLASELQDTVDNIISQCPDVDWNEDYLSYQIVCAIRSVLGKYIIPNIENSSSIAKFNIEAYKLTGKSEQTHGDIAIVVSHLFSNCGPVYRVGFLKQKLLL